MSAISRALPCCRAKEAMAPLKPKPKRRPQHVADDNTPQAPSKYKVHPATEFCPMMRGAELIELAEDIKVCCGEGGRRPRKAAPICLGRPQQFLLLGFLRQFNTGTDADAAPLPDQCRENLSRDLGFHRRCSSGGGDATPG